MVFLKENKREIKMNGEEIIRGKIEENSVFLLPLISRMSLPYK